MKNTKSNRIAESLKQRIAAGDYALREFPSERVLAASLSVSYLTARKAVQVLVEQDVLSRDTQGRATINAKHQQHQLKIAFLAPAFRSLDIDLHRQLVIQAGYASGITVRPIEYAHWDDPVIGDALQGFDGVLLYYSADAMPQRVFEQFRDSNCRIAVFDRDMTEHGMVSIRLHSDEQYERLFESMLANGYSQFHCVNCQGLNEEILRRQTIWSNWKAKQNIQGRSYDLPTPAWEDSIPRGYELFCSILDQGVEPDHVYVCTTYAAVQGGLRAAFERDLRPGRDFGLACYQSAVDPRYLCPTITCLEPSNMKDVCRRVFDWFNAPSKSDWQGPMLIHPQENTLFMGESTALSTQATLSAAGK
jgi:DNA-binding transcriptional regulator YhcF (GntR family)